MSSSSSVSPSSSSSSVLPPLSTSAGALLRPSPSLSPTSPPSSLNPLLPSPYNFQSFQQFQDQYIPTLSLLSLLQRKNTSAIHRPKLPNQAGYLRDFLDSFAHLCDSRYKGSTCTAVALEDAGDQPIMHLTANSESHAQRIKKFAESTIGTLQLLDANNNNDGAVGVAAQILIDSFKEPSRHRTETYVCKAAGSIKQIKKTCGAMSLPEGVEAIDKLLQTYKTARASQRSPLERSVALSLLTLECLALRDIDFANPPKSKILSSLKRQTKHVKATHRSRRDPNCVRLQHSIHRIGAQVEAVFRVTNAALQIKALCRICEVNIVRHPEEAKKAHTCEVINIEQTPDDILQQALDRLNKENLSWMIEQSIYPMQQVPVLFANLVGKCEDSENTKLENEIKIWQDYHRRPAFGKTLHCELILSHGFRNKRFKFFADDKFIGCSRPACYSCYQHLISMPGGCVAPSSSQNVFPYLQPPPLPGNDEDLAFHRQTWNNMQRKVDRDLVLFFRNHQSPDLCDSPRFASSHGSSCSSPEAHRRLIVL